MIDLSCLSTIIYDDLAAYIDLTNLKSWDLNTGFTSVSLTKWSEGYSSDIFLYDFGLTGFDNGRVKKMTDSITLAPADNKLKLYRIGYNNATGGTFYTSLGITGVTGQSVGNYFNVNGGYLQGFFKLKDYQFQTLPYRYANGVTIETLIKLSGSSYNDGYFLLLGARAEDKYIPTFSGECVQFTATTTGTTFGSVMATITTTSTVEFSGVTTSEQDFLNSTTIVTVPKQAIMDQFHTEDINIQNLNNDIDNNVIGFFLSSDNKIGYTRIDEDGNIQSNSSPYPMTNTGWTIIDIEFKPYDIITDPDLLSCTPPRKGDLIFYINGRQFWKVKDFEEFYFRGFKNSREKQLGVPFNVSWGGGSFGLKHSWHWDLNTHVIFDNNKHVQVSGFTFINNPNVVYDCPPAPVSGFTQYVILSADSATFKNIDPCDPLIITPETVLSFVQSGTTGTTGTTNQYYLEYLPDVTLISNRDYTFTVNFYENNIFGLYATGESGMFFSGSPAIEIVSATPFTTAFGQAFQWNKITYKIRLKDNVGIQNIKVGLYVKSDKLLNNGFSYYFDDFKYVGSDKLVQNPANLNQTIEEIYSKSFVGGIQKLRIYDNALSPQEILHNALIEAKNPAYGILVSKGGRIIYG